MTPSGVTAGVTSTPPCPALPCPARVVHNALLLLLREMPHTRGSSSSSEEILMTTDEMAALLRMRRDLTGETFNDGTIGAWRAALDLWTVYAVRGALIAAARAGKHVTVSDVVDRLPPLVVNLPTHRDDRPECGLCGGSGWAEADPALCSIRGVVPCRCTEGRRREEGYRRMVEQRTEAHLPVTGAAVVAHVGSDAIATPEQAKRALEAGSEMSRRQRLAETAADAERGEPGADQRLSRLRWWQAGAKGQHP